MLLSPAPVHIPLELYLKPWEGREIWLDAALSQESVKITPQGATVAAQFPPDGYTDGFYEETLRCRYRTDITPDQVIFTLFDTLETLEKKLELAASLGVTRAVGLWQELCTFQWRKQPDSTSIAQNGHS